MAEQHDPTRVEAGKKAAQHRNPDELHETLDKARSASLARSHEEKSEAAHIAALSRKEHFTPDKVSDDEKEELSEYRKERHEHHAGGQKKS
mmetsp:Transcript_15130/g.25916  ORF Transcript_15130/g.25916 Transcript_15130/m.25916 type:complete len:91 (-) Transcript_15130:166-438(-)|eukprot:CAMPEP_0196656936 /NCGR_PEP_ID=MMETSP1086-20130531/20518_1 /TAXON_ID=77921 /ORGANISM="Cyanoptyche  gloeocystis , Strain SAG4.97" /LENGTH=90 /DNA_ID=CAMNT_0041989867 /DNA_START=179 /DNA_END=451 /DNA_ORIENTATION=-